MNSKSTPNVYANSMLNLCKNAIKKPFDKKLKCCMQRFYFCIETATYAGAYCAHVVADTNTHTPNSSGS